MKRNCKRFNFLKKSTLFILLVSSLLGCQCGNSKKETNQRPPTDQENRFDAQRDFLEKERTAIESYGKDRQLKLQRTGTGLYYSILKDSAAGENAQYEDFVEYEYEIQLLNGKILYSSKNSGNGSLRIEKQDGEIGLHEALKLMGEGDEGLFILPSHLAFGVGGDQQKIPPRTPLVYELKIIDIQK